MRTLYSYSASKTMLHRLDPRTKLVMTLCYLLMSFVIPSPLQIGSVIVPIPPLMALLIVVAIWVLLRVPPWEYGILWIYLVPIVGGITFAHAVFLGGAPYVTLPGTDILLSQPGIYHGLDLGFRIVAMGFAFVMFAMSTDPFHWGLAMYKAGVPYKVAFMFAFGMRFYPLLQEEFGTIRDALRARGSDLLLSRNPLKLIYGTAVSGVPLGLGALRRSQNIALAMELRGFSFPEQTGVPRVIFRDVRLHTRDWVVMGIFVALLIASFGLRLGGVAAAQF